MRLHKNSPNETSEPRLLPFDAYRADLSEARRDRVDRLLRGQLHTIPIKPGAYLDKEGDRWILGTDNQWTDHFGATRSSDYTPMLSSFGPFTAEVLRESKDGVDG